MLSRVQFALTVMFHYLFPPLTIGVGLVLAFLETRYYLTDDELYHSAARFWTKIFGLNFAIGVASGIVMEFQFGTNWAAYSRFVGDVFGSALAAEGIFAFFLESGFLSLLLFGWDRISKGLHLFATWMVALGSMFSAVWIVVANSWQQTPQGHHIVPILRNGVPWIIDGEVMRRAEIVSFWEMVFNPSAAIRLTHVLIGAVIMGSFFVMSIAAWYLLRRRHLEFAARSFRGALLLGTIGSFGALASGHLHAVEVYRFQPAKLAAAEGHYVTGKGDLSLIGIPGADRLEYNVAIPGGLSLLLFGDRAAAVDGLDRFRPEDRPPVQVPFAAWHVMLACGGFFILLTSLGCLLWYRQKLFEQRWLLWVFVFAVIPAVASNQAGWILAEVGRQPWVVQPPVPRGADGQLILGSDGFVHLDESVGLRTSKAVSKAVSGEQVAASIAGFGAIYGLLLALWIFALNKKIQQGPDDHGEEASEGVITAARETFAERGGAPL